MLQLSSSIVCLSSVSVTRINSHCRRHIEHHHHHHSLLAKLIYRSRRQGSIKPNSMHSVTVFIQRSSKEIVVTQVTDLCWQPSVVRASSQVVMLRCCGLWGKECMQCVSRIVQCIAEQPVVRLIQQLLKVRQIRRAVTATFTASQERVHSFKVRRHRLNSRGGATATFGFASFANRPTTLHCMIATLNRMVLVYLHQFVACDWSTSEQWH